MSLKQRFFLLFISFVSFVFYLLACNQTWTKFFVDSLSNPKTSGLFCLDKYLYGDLYGLSYLKDFKEWNSQVQDTRKAGATTRAIDLYCIGDSYLASELTISNENAFLANASVKSFSWYGISSPKKILIDKSKKNVLLVECTERNVRINFSEKEPFIHSFIFDSNLLTSIPESKFKNDFKHRLLQTTFWKFIPENINQNLEMMLFGYKFFEPIKELKADFNYYFFERVAPKVSISPNKRNIYYRSTIDTSYLSSSFKYIPYEEINNIVFKINAIRNFYTQRGFDDVLFSFIPNPATIIEAGRMRYNNLLPDIRDNKNIQAGFIDVYEIFKNYPHPELLYKRTDTHWTSLGFQIWVDKLNQELLSF